MASQLTVDNIVGATSSSAVHVPGAVVQVKTGAQEGTVQTTSTTLVASNLKVTITPKFSNSLILVSWGGGNMFGSSTLSHEIHTSLYRQVAGGGWGFISGQSHFDETSLTGAGNISLHTIMAGRGSQGAWVPDKPSTTSAVEYQVYFKANTAWGTAVFNTNNISAQIMAMEIAQ